MNNNSTIEHSSVKSSNGSLNMLSREVPQIHILHPVMSCYLSLRDQGIDVETWIKNVDTDKVSIKDYPDVKAEELHYYYKLFRYLEKNGYFGDMQLENPSKKRLEPRGEACHSSYASQIRCRGYENGSLAGITLLT